MITVGQSFKQYMLTLSQCSFDTLKLSDELIQHIILEEFIIGCTSFFSEFTLDRLKSEGIIDDIINNKSSLLQKKVMKLDNSNLWNIESIKNALEWKEVLNLSEDIIKLINNKWTKDEIEYLYTM